MKYADSTLKGLNESEFKCGIKLGEFNIIARISEYNHQRNDPSVRVDIYTSVGDTQPPGPCENRPAWWAGSAVTWNVIEQSFASTGDKCFSPEDASASKVCDSDAFVRDGYLFARFIGTHAPADNSGAEFWLLGRQPLRPGFRMRLSRAFMIARLTDESGSWMATEATLAGVTTTSDIFSSFAQLGVTRGVCTRLTDFVLADMFLDTPTGDGKCDGMSAAWQFEALQTEGIAPIAFTIPDFKGELGTACSDGGSVVEEVH